MITASVVLFKNAEAEVERVIAATLSAKNVRKLFIVDNSPSETKLSLGENGRVQYLFNGGNLGYGAAHNIAIRKSMADPYTSYHLILNPDLEFEGKDIDQLHAFMNANPDVGNVMPKIIYPSGKIQRFARLLPTPLNLLGRRFAESSGLIKRYNRHYELEGYHYDRVLDSPNLSGCFMFTRKDILRRTGGFDERYFLYMEDVDLNRRINEISRTVIFPDVTVIHHYEKGSYKRKKLLFYHMVSAFRYFNKWGWFYDQKRKEFNQRTLETIHNTQPAGESTGK